LHELYILGIIADNPGLYLHEITTRIKEATNVTVDASTVCRLLRRNGFTRKKIVQTAKQRCSEYRATFMANTFAYKKDMFVFIDETGSDKRDHSIRRFGYALRGEAPVYHRLLARGKRISAIAAISCDGLLECELVTGSVNGNKFLEFVQGSLIPQMLPFDGINQRSIAVLDNCSVHHIPEVAAEFRKAGVLVIFLPPYSPDYMPIELCFSYIKYYLKSHDEILQAISDPKIIIKSAFDSVTKEQCNNWITRCGYE
jgi:transposase